MINNVLCGIVTIGLLIYFAVEFGWGGGNPNHPDHNPPGGGI